MFKFILLAAAILFVVTSMPQDNGRFKKRFAEPQLLPTQLRPIIAEPSDPWICIGRAKCNSRCAICCDTALLKDAEVTITNSISLGLTHQFNFIFIMYFYRYVIAMNNKDILQSFIIILNPIRKKIIILDKEQK